MSPEQAAELISRILNPPIVASVAFLIILFLEGPASLVALVIIVLVFGTVIPLIVVIYLSEIGLVEDIYVTRRESRTIPFVGAIVSYILGTLALLVAKAPPIVTALMLCYCGNSLIMMLISRRWKISVHASGITGPATVLIYALGLVAFPFLLLIIPVTWARIRLNAHTLAQVSAGALLTIVTTWLQLGIYLAFL